MAFFRTFTTSERPRLAPLIECNIVGVTVEDAAGLPPGERTLKVNVRQPGGAMASLFIDGAEAELLRDLLAKNVSAARAPAPINKPLAGDKLFAVTVGGKFRCRAFAPSASSAEGRVAAEHHVADDVEISATEVSVPIADSLVAEHPDVRANAASWGRIGGRKRAAKAARR